MHQDDTPWIVAQQQSHKSESQNSALLYLVVSCVVNLLVLVSLCFQHDEEMSCGWRPWFGRVPSHANPADEPSRLDTRALDAQGVPRVRVDWQADFIQTLISR